MEEAQPACGRLHSRLSNLLAELKRVETTQTSASSLNECTSVVAAFLKLLQRHSGKPLIYRVVRHKSMVDGLQQVNEGVEELFRELLDVDVVNWSDQWEADCQLQDAEIEAAIKDKSVVLRDLQSSRARADAWFTLKFEVERRSELQNEKTMRWMTSVMQTIAAGLKTLGGALPEWFLPEYEVQVERKPFRRGCFGSLHRGVLLSSGVNVVVKRFSVDEMMVDEHVQLKLDKEFETLCGLEHPNVMKVFGGSPVGSPPFIVYEDAMDRDLRSFWNRSDEIKERMYTLLHQAAMGLNYLHKQGVCLAGRATFTSDVYSLAMCMIEAATNQPPVAWLDAKSVREYLKNGLLPSRPDSMTDETWALVVSMTKFDPEKRVDLESVINKLKHFADRESAVTLNCCCVCAASISVEWKFCAQCGSQLPVSPPSPELTGNLSVPQLVAATRTESAARQDQALLLLVQACIDDDKRREFYASDVISTLVDLVETGRSHFARVCALQCLSMEKTPELISSYSDGKIIELGQSIPVLTPQECTWLVGALMTGSCQNKLKAAIHCAGAITANRGKGLRSAGAVEALITLLKSDDEPPKIWSAIALGHLADHDVNWRTLMKKNVAGPLASILQTGSDMQKSYSAWALCRLAISDATDDLEGKEGLISLLVSLLNCGTREQKNIAARLCAALAVSADSRRLIVEIGGLQIAVELLRVGSDVQREQSARVLACLSLDEGGSIAVATEGGIPPIMELLRFGISEQKEQAAKVLVNLTLYERSRDLGAREGVIPPCVELLRYGNEKLKEYAALVLANLAHSAKDRCAIAESGAIAFLVSLLRGGTPSQRESAVWALANLSVDKKNRSLIAAAGGIAALKALLQSGTDNQKGQTARALTNLTLDQGCREEIAREGCIPVFVGLLRSGDEKPKEQTVRALTNMAVSQSHRRRMIQAGCVACFVGLLRDGTAGQKLHTVRAVALLTIDVENRDSIARAGGIPPLVTLAWVGNDVQKELSTCALANLSASVENRITIVRVGACLPLVALLSVGT
ncbi:hypothetical protein PHYSODRAFT_456709, partial [Phytophthora sojae]